MLDIASFSEEQEEQERRTLGSILGRFVNLSILFVNQFMGNLYIYFNSNM